MERTGSEAKAGIAAAFTPGHLRGLFHSSISRHRQSIQTASFVRSRGA